MVMLKNALIVKSNPLIEARFKFTLWEMRVFTVMISFINKDDIEFGTYKIYIKDLMKFFKVKSNVDYEIIRQVPKALSKKQIEVYYYTKDTKLKQWKFLNVFTSGSAPAHENKGSGFIELKLNDELKSELLELKRLFSKYDLKNIIPLRSVHSFRMYELLKQYEFIGKREFDVDDLKEILGVEDKYKLYTDFRRNVIQRAERDLKKHCDIHFTFEEIKRGRRIGTIIFTIHSKEKIQLELPEAEIEPYVEEDSVFSNYYHFVKDWISKKTFDEWIATYSEEQIKNGIQYTKKQLDSGIDIKNIAGYLLSVIRQTNLFDNISSEDLKKKKQSQNKKRESEITEKILNSSDKVFNNLISKTRNWFIKNKSDFDMNRTFEELGRDQEFIHILVQITKREYPDSFR